MPPMKKQATWDGMQPKNPGWDAEINTALERGKDVPEIDWLEPGEDAAWEVSFCGQCQSRLSS